MTTTATTKITTITPAQINELLDLIDDIEPNDLRDFIPPSEWERNAATTKLVAAFPSDRDEMAVTDENRQVLAKAVSVLDDMVHMEVAGRVIGDRQTYVTADQVFPAEWIERAEATVARFYQGGIY